MSNDRRNTLYLFYFFFNHLFVNRETQEIVDISMGKIPAPTEHALDKPAQPDQRFVFPSYRCCGSGFGYFWGTLFGSGFLKYPDLDKTPL